MAEPPAPHQSLLSSSSQDLSEALARTGEGDRALESWLAWQAEAGLDFALGETPVDRFAPAAPEAGQASAAGMSDAARFPTPAPGVHPARAARSLEELAAALDAFEGCALKTTATQLVFSDGTPGAPVMIIGEAPGADEDRIGRPFVGRAGRLLDKMLKAIGLTRADVYIANVVPWRPPGNRTPSAQEAAACLPFLKRQIELARPRFILCVGGPAASAVLDIDQGIMKARGRWRDYQGEGWRAKGMATLHPAYLLRQPAAKRLAWRDLRTLRAALRETATQE